MGTKENSILYLAETMKTKQPYISWLKTYDVSHRSGFFNIYVTAHKNGEFFGAVFYYIHNRQREHELTPAFEFKVQQFTDTTENGAFTQCTKWIDQNLPGKYSTIEIGSTDFTT